MRTPIYGAIMDDWNFCKASLREVSRTFAIPIGMLRERLEVAVTCGYLLCRTVDTVEDSAELDPDGRDALYAAFLRVVERGGAPERFAEIASLYLRGDGADEVLARNLPRVMRAFGVLPRELRVVVLAWVSEMARGMAIYSHRRPGADGVVALLTLHDLERYCYFVAGTVGHMLTDLFLAEVDGLDPSRRQRLRANAEEFGLGLQLVNILKDITDDRERNVSFIPRAVCAEGGLSISELLAGGRRAEAHAALEPVFERARGALAHAFDYCMALPPEARDVRLFCLLPLWMAVRTLAHAQRNDAQLVAGHAVKISREEVGQIIAECQRCCSDDDAIRAAWARLPLAAPTASPTSNLPTGGAAR